MIATAKNNAHNNMLEQLVVGNWTLEELINAKSNFESLLDKQIYKSLAPQQQSLIDNIEEKKEELRENLLKNLTPEERDLYKRLHGGSYNKAHNDEKLNASLKNNSTPESKTGVTNKEEDKVVSLTEYRKSK
ncbi:MAG: hypothetical protein R6V17_08530 [Halanaerobacter sp.]